MTGTIDQPLSRNEIRTLVRPDHVHRRAYADPEVFALEQQRIFGRLWLYVAHESQLRNPGDSVRAPSWPSILRFQGFHKLGAV